MTLSRRTLMSTSLAATVTAATSAQAQSDEKPANSGYGESQTFDDSTKAIYFSSDGPDYTPAQYTQLLAEIASTDPKLADEYGSGGAVAKLEAEFARITGKEKAIYLPTGTMANQLAGVLLSGDNPKIMVQDISHYHRDEAHAAQRIHGRRLVPVKTGAAQYTLEELKAAIEADQSQEVFPTKVGAISLENPVRRANGEVFDINEIRRISKYARAKGIKLHLDGARLYWASAYSGVPIKDYCQHFDTVYISLYKYLGASGGAILCSSDEIISQIPGLMKIHGGMMASSWTNAAVALHGLKRVEADMAQAREKFAAFAKLINTRTGMKIEATERGSNVFLLHLGKAKPEAFQAELRKANIEVGQYEEQLTSVIPINANVGIIRRPNAELRDVFDSAYRRSV